MKQLHEYAKFFPPMEGDEFTALCDDIKAHGLRNPIVLYQDKVLDGRNRERACDKTGVRPRYETFKNGSAFEYVISQNVLRRHLTTSQRAVLALELEKKFADEAKNNRAGVGGRGRAKLHPVSSAKQQRIVDRQGAAAVRAAKALHVGHASVETAKRLEKDAPHLMPSVRAGKVTLTEALVQHRNNRAEEWARKDKERAKRNHLQKHNRQVAAFLEVSKAFIVALKVAEVGAERFSAQETVVFVRRRLGEIRRLMDQFESQIIKQGGKKNA